MYLLRLNAQDFRNIKLARLELNEGRQFFVGDNGQGKTNLLEAAGLLGALRSFRGAAPREMIRHGTTEARVVYQLHHERDGETSVEIIVRSQRREVLINGTPCQKLADFLGRFPVVALSSNDLQLLRGAPEVRRRALDLAVSSHNEGYFNALRRYHEALDGRNALLRRATEPTATEMNAWENIMAAEAVRLTATRAESCAALGRHFQVVYAQLTHGVEESPKLAYKPNTEAKDAAGWMAWWEGTRASDREKFSTQHGPHRDDFSFELQGHRAKAFASEGQQRGLVIAWRLAQAAWQKEITGIAPLLLADDVLGELDPKRRSGFWQAAAGAGQVLASGTSLPVDEDNAWKVWHVKEGEFSS